MSLAARNYWRSIEELADSPGFAAFVEREAPRLRGLLDRLDRRRFLQLTAAAMALSGLGACGPEPNPRQMLPYVEEPPGIIPGQNRYYATAHLLAGHATGVLVAHQMARPYKVEGNPDHPASLGAASAIMQASILGLYDPYRAQSVIGQGQIDSWEHFVTVMFERTRHLSATHGKGMRLLTGSVTSPSLAAQIGQLQQAFPEMRWHQWEPLARDNEAAALRQAFGKPVEPVYDLKTADVVFAVGSDLISAAPGWLAYARQFAARRRPAETGGTMSRVYAIESTPTLIGAKADHRLPLPPAEILAGLRWLAATLGAGPQNGAQPPAAHAAWFAALARDLKGAPRRALVHVGPEQPVEAHHLAIAINNALGAFGATVRPIEPVAAQPVLHLQSLRELVADMASGKVDTLLMLGVNPVYDAPADLGFAAALARVPFSVSLALYGDETTLKSTWHVPARHDYEMWGDARAFDGTTTILQPQVRPLYGGRSPQAVLAVLQGNTLPEEYPIVQGFWQRQAAQKNAGDFAQFWHDAVRIGVVPDSAAAPVAAPPQANPPAAASGSTTKTPGLDLLLRPDEGLWDGRFADNAWLLEMPRSFTRLTWENAALVAPSTAKRLDLHDGDGVVIAASHARIAAPVLILPGQAADCVTLWLGFGRQAGGLGVGVGVDAYKLRTSNALWQVSGVSLTKTGKSAQLSTIQGHDRVEGRDLIREGSLAQYRADPGFLAQNRNPASLYPPYAYPGRAWAMSIDLNSCIGCQACVIACQAENNIPSVGRDLVLEQRIMHWLRIDRYYAGPAENPETAFEPMPCMHCEDAPCEVVCPVHATVHDHEGLNLMVYNRCVGTRFCSNNCPYKVRRFNFFDYTDSDDRPAASWNPEVTVRARGVMEKCTYCIQRIREAEIAADRDNRRIDDGAVVTACQQSCPTQAIVFGDRNDKASAVAGRKATPLDYVLLDDLNTRPRTSYTAMIRNPSPDLEEKPS